MQPAVPTTARRHGRRSGARRAAALVLTLVAAAIGVAQEHTATAVTDDDWLGIVNTYRAMSGLPAVTADATWSSEARDHSCYMLHNGISHDEVPGKTGYTTGGDTAGNSGNVAVSSAIGATPRSHIDLWMTGPFHAIGILRYSLATSGFGLCQNASTPTWHSGATLDVIRGIDHGRVRPSTPIVFPGNGATVPLHAFITESPNPLDYCGWTGSAGLPLIAMLPNDVSTANATLTGPNGPIEVCTLHPGNTGGTAGAILAGDHAVVVVPRVDLADGAYQVAVTTNGGNAAWSFRVDRDAELSVTAAPLPNTSVTSADTRFEAVSPFRLVDSRRGQNAVRIAAGKATTITIADSGVKAVSANFTVVNPDASGYLTAYNCTSSVPTVSTIGYVGGQVLANQAIVPLQDGKLCLFSLRATDVIVDVNGFYRVGQGGGFQPLTPKRLHDSRPSSRLAAGEERPVQVVGVPGGAPAGTTSVALNVTAVKPSDSGHLQIYPCGTTPDVSNINYVAGEIRPNAVVVPVDAQGRICVRTHASTDLLVGITGYFTGSGGLDFAPLSPIRLLDSRSLDPAQNPATGGRRVAAGQVVQLHVAGRRGIPADASAVSINLTAVGPSAASYLTAFPCGTRPETSNLNIVPAQGAVANGAMVKLSSTGDLCVYALEDVHVIVDINGVWR